MRINAKEGKSLLVGNYSLFFKKLQFLSAFSSIFVGDELI